MDDIDDIEQIEYRRVTPKDERIDLGIEDIKYRVKRTRNVPTERGEQLEKIKTDITTSQPYRYAEKTAPKVAEMSKGIASGIKGAAAGAGISLRKYLEWRKEQRAKREGMAPQVKVSYQKTKAPPKKRIVYVNGGAQLQKQPQPNEGVPFIGEGFSLPDISGRRVNAPNVLSDSRIPSIVGSSRPTASTFDKIMGGGTSGNTFDKLRSFKPGNTFDKLGLGGSSGVFERLGVKKKGGFW